MQTLPWHHHFLSLSNTTRIPTPLESANRHKVYETLENGPSGTEWFTRDSGSRPLWSLSVPLIQRTVPLSTTTISVSTFRACFIGIVFVAAGGFINQFLSIRYPGVSVGSNVAQSL
ncbi:hypothetical protein BDM02DRAFT_3114182 [Thelephora ganbajun]|uniref:Uncharacterized protein n=1 Tax=Thelephora ganbajun TaxID=370292 RepID=A0ACB6ZI17_THEGA|nr:hypothetical protein BDM02DRAFT_3114182 [Thelephora ganbajun]